MKKVVLAVPRKVQRKASARKAKGRSKPNVGVNPFAQFGGLAGTMMGGPMGGALGLAAGNLISHITGYGDYKVSKNTVSNGNSVPTFRNGGDGMSVCHREFLTDITGSILFVNTSYSINPGLVSVFPWLSLLAADFEEYEMRGLVFEYRPSSGTAVSSTSSALGVVILATDYDALNTHFSNKQQMESYEYATSSVPFTACIHPVECARNKNVLNNMYVRTLPVPSGGDVRLYDMGNFQIATQGMQSAYVIGELWISYDVVFRKPRLPSQAPRTAYGRAREGANGTATSAEPFGTSGAQISGDSNIGMTAYGTTGVILSAPGNYLVLLVMRSTGAISGVTSLSVGTNITFGPALFRDNTVTNGGLLVTPDTNYYAFVQVNTAGIGAANAVVPVSTGVTAGKTDFIATLLGNSLSLSHSISYCGSVVSDGEEWKVEH